ncbi:hypothetical protein Forpe1208_v003432 [Fusarium oxysporum f. sp. rapae]|uniref:Uncharacterized protein n=1 Tax=Fusarium oxysporum f. sp. rapae TaxID=485398 RepID=A0A8J5PHB4_FUSOX|nr:hypothetical protein Forpe1208_v003432 [Fusarium oxysporum f. sp. rapae]
MCYSCNTKGYLSSRCKDGRGPMVERRTDELEMMARPAQNYGPGIAAREVSRLPSHLEARASSSSRSDSSSSRAITSQASSSRASSRPRAQTNIQYEPSIMSVDSKESLANGLMSFRFEIKDMGERIEYLIALRKRLSHKQKKIDPAEYQQALNSPSMIVLYEAYKQAADYTNQCKNVYDQRMAQYNNKFLYAPKKDQMEIYALQEKWVRATVNTAEQRLNYLQQFPCAYQNKESIRGHILAAEGSMHAALTALQDVDMNKRACVLFEKGNYQALENSMILAYGLHDVMTEDVQKACDMATETYAKEILNWPNGRLEKPEIFKVESPDEGLRDLDDCIERFVGHLHDVFEASPPKDLPTYPHAFVVMDENCLKADATATLVLAHKPDDKWKVQHCSVPIEVELGLAVESLRLGDVTETDMLDQFTN